MKPLALFVITSDPRVSGRPVEAMRIAAGIATWGRVEVALYLSGAAVLTLGDEVDDLVEGANLSNYIPLLGDLVVYIDSHSAFGFQNSALRVERLDTTRLAEIAAQSHCVLRF